MSFNGREESLAGGQPIRLYEFRRGALRWSYNTSDRDHTYANQIYRSVRGGISDNGILHSGDPNTDKFVVNAPADLDVAQIFRGTAPSDEIGLTVRDMHYGDTEVLVSWIGNIANVNWPALDRCRITCLSIEASMYQPGLVETYTRSCSAVLGDSKCGINLDAYRVMANLQGMTGATLITGAVGAYPIGYFTAGYVEWDIGSGEFNRRHIEMHSGSTLWMLGGTAGIPAGAQVRIYPGCDFLITTCDAKFGNKARFRGIPHLQGRSPFDGNQVW